MRIIATSPIEGVNPGASVDVPEGKGRWYVANGYARLEDDGDHLYDTGVEAAVDPTLAANREAPETVDVVKNAEFKPSTSKHKIVPGKRSTQVEANDTVLSEQAEELGRSIPERNTAFDGDETPQQAAAAAAEVDRVEVDEPPTAADLFGKDQAVPTSVEQAREEAEAVEQPKAKSSRKRAASTS